MKVLVVGSSGSEHALAWKLKQSPKVTDLYITPGNAGTAEVGTNLDISETEKIVEWVATHPMDLVVVRADRYLAEGLVDKIQTLGDMVFGPTQAAAKIEWSKVFAKQFMVEEGIPTARYAAFDSYDEAWKYATAMEHPLVVKADGLAMGKGVVICKSLAETESAIKESIKAGPVVIEEFLQGKEISIHALCDAENAILFPPSQDHKRAFDNDMGPNTGGMGSIAPVPWVTAAQMEEIKNKIVLPTLRGLQKRGTPFTGLLFPGVMITQSGPKVIEFNARFGDPETQSYMRLLESDVFDMLLASAQADISEVQVRWKDGAAATIMLASKGYPGAHEKGAVISGIPDASSAPDVEVFHSGTVRVGGEYVTNGGRVLGVSATGVDLAEALENVYVAISKINFAGMHYRIDIGKKSL